MIAVPIFAVAAIVAATLGIGPGSLGLCWDRFLHTRKWASSGLYYLN
jgi:hypothetical protein